MQGLEFSLDNDSNVYARIEDNSDPLNDDYIHFFPINSNGVFLYETPEPATLGLIGAGLVGLLALKKQRGK